MGSDANSGRTVTESSGIIGHRLTSRTPENRLVWKMQTSGIRSVWSRVKQVAFFYP